MGRLQNFGRRFFTLLILFTLTGCAHQFVERFPPEAAAPTDDSSFEPFTHRMIQGVPLSEYLGARVFRLSSNLVPVRARGVGGKLLGLEIAEGKRYGVGWAVPLTADGYFLTAAHILHKGSKPFYLINWSSEQVAAGPVRVVWDAWKEIDSEKLDVLIPADFAIIHIPLESGDFAEWAWDWELRPGMEMVAPGGAAFWPPRLTGGRLLSARPGVDGYGKIWTSGAVGTVVLRHDAHKGYGDSGAPVFLPDGRLAGITIGGGTRNAPLSTLARDGSGASRGKVMIAVAVRPDHQTLTRIIRQDRSRMASASQPTRSTFCQMPIAAAILKHCEYPRPIKNRVPSSPKSCDNRLD